MHIDEKSKKLSKKRGFTIVELLVVIIIIAILAAISVVVYSGIRKRAAYAAIQSEAKNFGDALALYNAENGDYPTEDEFNCEEGASSPEAIDFCYDSDYYIEYEPDPLDPDPDPPPYEVWSCESSWNPYANPDEACPEPCYGEQCGGGVVCPTGPGTCLPGLPIECPDAFISVPGSARYGTAGFCVMKYEAKINNGKAVSNPVGIPINGVTQQQAIDYSKNACNNCGLISEAQWMTIAQNVLSVERNWSGNSVGSGYIYSGHNDSSQIGTNDVLPASNNDNDGYFMTDNNSSQTSADTFGSIGASQRRTLFLNNNEVIWDLAGNVSEWTSGSTTSQPGIVTGGDTLARRSDWSDVTESGQLDVNPFPYGTGIDEIILMKDMPNGYSLTGIGQLRSSIYITSREGIIRGGSYTTFQASGVLDMIFSESFNPDFEISSHIGFRVTTN